MISLCSALSRSEVHSVVPSLRETLVLDSRMSEEIHLIGTKWVVLGIEKNKIITENKASSRAFGCSRVTML